jgi:type II secretory pathway pseudopilin PulG
MRAQLSSGKASLTHQSAGCSGMTLVEVCVALALTAFMTMGLFSAGLQVRRFSEYNRLATEARSLAKERLEEIIAVGRVNLAKDTLTLLNASATPSSLGYSIQRQPRVTWHASDGSVVATDGVYAEISVDVSYASPITGETVVDSYSTIID